MPGGQVGPGPSIYDDPQYAPHQAAFRAASERNAIYAEPILMVMPVGPALRGFRAARGAAGLFARAGRATCNCFVEGTEVQTPNGFRAIDQLQVGDLVLARDENTGETAYKPIVALIAGSEREIWEVTVETTDAQGQVQREPIGTTDEHPWRTADGRWVETKDLAAGTELVSSDGDRTVVVSVSKTDRVEPTYNFEVEGFHTYFVGEAGVWVHNACDRFFRGALRRQILKEGAECAYCGKIATQVDHVIPHKQGGPTTLGNGIPACTSCNASKGAQNVTDWLLSRFGR
jgi:hypothetical protein